MYTLLQTLSHLKFLLSYETGTLVILVTLKFKFLNLSIVPIQYYIGYIYNITLGILF